MESVVVKYHRRWSHSKKSDRKWSDNRIDGWIVGDGGGAIAMILSKRILG